MNMYMCVCMCVCVYIYIPLQYFCLENPLDRRAWWATVHGGGLQSMGSQSQTQLNIHRKGEIVLMDITY